MGSRLYMSAQSSSYCKKFAKDRFIYVSFELFLMNKNQSMQTILLLGTILAVAMVGIASSNARVYAGNGGYDTGDDHINWKKFQESNTYQDADKDTKKCFENAHDRGDNLAGYEVKKCEEDSGYGKDDGDKNKDYGNKNRDDGNKNKDDGNKNKDYGNKNKDDSNKNKDDSNKGKDSSDNGKSGDNGGGDSN